MNFSLSASIRMEEIAVYLSEDFSSRTGGVLEHCFVGVVCTEIRAFLGILVIVIVIVVIVLVVVPRIRALLHGAVTPEAMTGFKSDIAARYVPPE